MASPLFPVAPASSAGGGNATVPADAPIQPPQAAVNVGVSASLFTAITEDQSLDFSSKAITSIDPDLILAINAICVSLTGGQAGTFDLSGNDLTQQNVDDILEALAGSGTSFGTINLSGGSSASPTVVEPEDVEDGVVEINMSAYALGQYLVIQGDSGAWVFGVSGYTVDSGRSSDFPLADSYIFSGVRIVLGTSDSPTAAQKAAKFVSIFNGNPDWSSHAAAAVFDAAKVRVTVFGSSKIPIQVDADSGAGMLISIEPGVGEGNPSITALSESNWTVTTN